MSSTGLFAITDALTAHQAEQDAALTALKAEADTATAAVTALQAAPPSGVTQAQVDAVAASVTNVNSQVSALTKLVGAPNTGT